MTRREKILKAVQKIWNKCDHTFHRLGGVDDCPDCKIIKALCEENEKLRSALELRKWHDDDCYDSREKFNKNETCECGASAAKQALSASTAIDEILKETKGE